MAAPTEEHKVQAGHVPAVLPPFKNIVVVSDSNCGMSSAQIEMRYRNVFQWVQNESQERTLMPSEIVLPEPIEATRACPSVMHVNDIPFGNVDYGAYALYACYRALGRSRPNLFIHAIDAGKTASAQYSVMVTDYGNTFIGPNNASLGLVRAYFEERGIHTKMWDMNLEKLEELEQYRMEEPTYHIPRTFHGRDIFAVAAGLLSGGISPVTLADTELSQGAKMSVFAETITAIPEKLNTPVRCHAFRDNTFGNLKTNLTLDALNFDQLVEESAQFKVTATLKERTFWQPKKRSLVFTAKRILTEAKKSDPVLFLGSTFAPQWDERFVELALHMQNASQALGLPRSYTGAQELFIERIR